MNRIKFILMLLPLFVVGSVVANHLKNATNDELIVRIMASDGNSQLCQEKLAAGGRLNFNKACRQSLLRNKAYDVTAIKKDTQQRVYRRCNFIQIYLRGQKAKNQLVSIDKKNVNKIHCGHA